METLNLPKEELKKFAEDVLERFNNPFVDHQVTSIMLNSFPKYEMCIRDSPCAVIDGCTLICILKRWPGRGSRFCLMDL